VRTGEESGDLPEMLAEVASIYTEESERALDAGVKILEPVLIVGMGLIIAVIVAAVMLPIFQSNALVH
jgi:type II secretory pathway component PulF